MEASALQAPAGIARSRLSIGSPLLRLRSDDQLVALFRGGHDEAFRVIHDRYRQRLFAYARQMLPGSRQDAEDALQDIFVRAYSGLRASDRQLALRAWLYRIAHNRCIDELRRPVPPSPQVMAIVRPPEHDPIAEAERRESLRRLIADVRRLPEQQRSALLMRELGGMAYLDLSVALGVSVPAVKSLLVRARIGLAQSIEARDVACGDIREELIMAHDRGVRPGGVTRRHMRDCKPCRDFRVQIRGTSRRLAAIVPFGPMAALGNLFGFGVGGGAAGGSAAGGSGAAAAGGVAGTTGAIASIGAVAGGAAGHVVTILAAAVVTAGGAVEIQRSVSAAPQVLHEVTATASQSVSAASIGSTGGSRAGPVSRTGATTAPALGGGHQAPPSIAAAVSSATAGPPIPAVDQLGSSGNAAPLGSPAPTATQPTSAVAAAGVTSGSANGAASSTAGTGASSVTDAGSGPTGANSSNGPGSTGSGTATSGPTAGASGVPAGTGTGNTVEGPSTSGSVPAGSSSKTVPAVEKRIVRLRARPTGRRLMRHARG